MSESFSAWQIHGAWLALEFIMEYINFSHEMVLTNYFFYSNNLCCCCFCSQSTDLCYLGLLLRLLRFVKLQF